MPLGDPRLVSHAPGDTRLVSFDASYYKVKQYIWFRGGDLNIFRNIRPFLK